MGVRVILVGLLLALGAATGNAAEQGARERALLRDAAVVRSMPWVEEGEMFNALSALVGPGATVEEARVVLPPMKGVPVITLFNGQSFYTRYAVSRRYWVQCSGVSRHDARGELVVVLTGGPRVVDSGK